MVRIVFMVPAPAPGARRASSVYSTGFWVAQRAGFEQVAVKATLSTFSRETVAGLIVCRRQEKEAEQAFANRLEGVASLLRAQANMLLED